MVHGAQTSKLSKSASLRKSKEKIDLNYSLGVGSLIQTTSFLNRRRAKPVLGHGTSFGVLLDISPMSEPNILFLDATELGICDLTLAPISIAEILERISHGTCGANSIFVGSTREDLINGNKVVYLQYEAYESMAYKIMTQMCSDIRDSWPNVRNIAIIHRLGNVMVKEPSVVIAISAPHRNDAMEATNWCVEKLKSSVPIWKKEVYDTNTFAWT